MPLSFLQLTLFTNNNKAIVGGSRPICDRLFLAAKVDPVVFPNLMGDELAAKVPPVVMYTTEHDVYRRMAEEGAKLYQRNGKLLDYGRLEGLPHGACFMHFGLERVAVWYEDFARIVVKFLL